MWNGSISLPTKKINEQNDNGFPVNEHYEFMGGIQAEVKDATRSEQTIAQQFGYTADTVVCIMACNYNGASFFVDDATGETYDIKRTYKKPNAMLIELIGQRRDCHAF